MKHFFMFFSAVGLFLISAGTATGAPADINLAREAGEIRGTLSFCGQESVEAIEVFIPGTSFIARTDSNGNFTICYVPAGTWNIVFMKNGQKLGSQSDVKVFRRDLTVLGTIVLCQDSDADGYFPPDDCDDTNPNIYPGAPEVCGNGKDDNCDTFVDENCPVCTDSDADTFYAEPGCGSAVDCDDTDWSVNPNALELCGNGKDDNCNGEIDEGCVDVCDPNPCNPGEICLDLGDGSYTCTQTQTPD